MWNNISCYLFLEILLAVLVSSTFFKNFKILQNSFHHSIVSYILLYIISVTKYEKKRIEVDLVSNFDLIYLQQVSINNKMQKFEWIIAIDIFI